MKHPPSHTDLEHFFRTVAAEATSGLPVFISSNRGNSKTAIKVIFAAALAIGALPVQAEDNALRKAERSAYDARSAANSFDRIGRGIQQRDAASILGSAGRLLDLANRTKDRWAPEPRNPSASIDRTPEYDRGKPSLRGVDGSTNSSYSSVDEFHRQFGH